MEIKEYTLEELDWKDEFFDSFREDYPGFDDWLEKKKKDKVHAIVDDGKVKFIIKTKVETDPSDFDFIHPVMTVKKRLKVSMLKSIIKVDRSEILDLIFYPAYTNHVEEIYFTVRVNSPEKEKLIHMFKEFGFKYYGKKGGDFYGLLNGEEVYIMKWGEL